MNHITRSSSYLIRNAHSYCFRINIPKDIQPFVKKRVATVTFRTGYMSVAKQRARAMAAETQTLFQWIRELIVAGDLTDDEIKQIVNEHIHNLFRWMESLRISVLDLKTKHQLLPRLSRYTDEMGKYAKQDLIDSHFKGTKKAEPQ